MRTRIVGPALLLVVASACAARTPSESLPAADRNTLTEEQIAEHGPYNNVLEVIRTLRPNWLETRGSDSFYTPSVIRVYLDASLAGGVDVLSTMSVMDVVYIRHYDGVAATARWGVGHGRGVIYVATHADRALHPDGSMNRDVPARSDSAPPAPGHGLGL